MGTRERNCSGTCFAGVGWGWGWWWNQVLCLLSLTTSQPVLSCQRLQMSLVLAVVLSGQRPQMSQTFRAWLLFWFLVTSSRFTQQPTDRAWLPRSHAWSGAHWLWGHAWNPTPDTGWREGWTPRGWDHWTSQLTSSRLNLAEPYESLDKDCQQLPSPGTLTGCVGPLNASFPYTLFCNKTPFFPHIVHEIHFSSFWNERLGNHWPRVALVADLLWNPSPLS